MAYSEESKTIKEVREIFSNVLNELNLSAGEWAVLGSRPYSKGVDIIKKVGKNKQITQHFSKNYDAWKAMKHPDYHPESPSKKFLFKTRALAPFFNQEKVIGSIGYREELKKRLSKTKDLKEDVSVLLNDNLEIEFNAICKKIKKELES